MEQKKVASISSSLFFRGYRILRSGLHRILNRSDYQRWTDLQNLETWWSSRTEKIAGLIPKDAPVIEFGAGRRQLEKLLDSGCTYFPSDLVDRGPGTIICDLNKRPLPDLRKLEPRVAVFSGVLEYVRDLDSVIAWLSHLVPQCVASYHYVPRDGSVLQTSKDRLGRLHNGYMNHHTEESLVALFKKYGFVCTTKDTWTCQRIFLFTQSTDALPVGRALQGNGLVPGNNAERPV